MVSENYLKKVNLSADVYSVCIQHALTTEKQEIMGLLIGEVNEEERVSNISACVILHRSDKQPDRVEISPEQLCTASMHADQLTKKLCKPMRVLGWYHSHPHITVWPSHVDIRTQAMYQTMDPMFVGLIFSVFQSDTNNSKNQIQVTCFQAHDKGSDFERKEIDLSIIPSPFQKYNLEEIAKFSKILSQEEVECGDSKVNDIHDELCTLHNDAFKTLTLVHIVSKVTRPLCESLEERKQIIYLLTKELEHIKLELGGD
ncbi:unnamed protein product [Phyllotreta striolata]|uniref:MPN domain-containing protein n=1 Tax=Phyllotreta striolata TaxID=444603 RepID=A0A9N9TUL9_PHYSR|nr:unnamed protein product [Phyllotreta striolata]